MDKTFNKIMMCFVCLVIFDTLALDISFKKDKFGVMSAIANTIYSTYSFVKAVR